jgi:outer membrane protein assembly factor BamA
MRKIYIGLAIFASTLWSVNLIAQSDTTLLKMEEKEKIKKGWNIGGLPVISYDSDLGLQLGALVNLYHYGDGSRYPKYDHSIYVEGSWYLKGSGIFRFYYDSDKLIKGIRTSIDLSYLPDKLFKFYGFNGYESVYNNDWTDDADTNYLSRNFYRTDRKFFRAKLDFQGKITSDKFRWMAGVDFYNIKMDTVNFYKLNEGKDQEDILPDTSLFQNYNTWGIISPEERSGGSFTVFKAGLVYDSRNNDALPTKGIWTEAILAMAPKFTSNMDEGFIKFAVTHRQYFTLVKDRLSLAYRLGMQVNVAGHTPYYAQGLMYYVTMKGAYNEGLGGAKTIRGIERNRVVGDGIVYGNFELRWQFWYFSFINQNWYMALSGFFDTGRVIQYIHIQDGVASSVFDDPDFFDKEYLDPYSDGFHSGYGGGLHIGMNQNFIIAIDYGRALSIEDGKSGLYIGLNWLF